MWEFQVETLYVCPKPFLGTYTKFQLDILLINVFSGIVHFREIILGALAKFLWNNPRLHKDNASMDHSHSQLEVLLWWPTAKSSKRRHH